MAINSNVNNRRQSSLVQIAFFGSVLLVGCLSVLGNVIVDLDKTESTTNYDESNLAFLVGENETSSSVTPVAVDSTVSTAKLSTSTTTVTSEKLFAMHFGNNDNRTGRDNTNYAQCGGFSFKSNNRSARIVGGREADIEEFPWQVSLQKFRLAFPLPIPDWGHTCGASILNDRWLLTAAHCVDGIINSVFPGQMRAVIGTDRWRYTLFQRAIQLLPIATIIKHPQWNNRRAQNDIALVKTSKPISFGPKARPICLPGFSELPIKAGQQVTVAGYGYTTEHILINRLPTKLQAVQIPVVNVASCQRSYNMTRIPITDRMICAGSAAYGHCSGALKGDSGSALISYDERGLAVHTGIVSFSLPCRVFGAPDVFTRTSKYIDWINKVMNSAD